jgi:hypothetical protein
MQQPLQGHPRKDTSEAPPKDKPRHKDKGAPNTVKPKRKGKKNKIPKSSRFVDDGGDSGNEDATLKKTDADHEERARLEKEDKERQEREEDEERQAAETLRRQMQEDQDQQPDGILREDLAMSPREDGSISTDEESTHQGQNSPAPLRYSDEENVIHGRSPSGSPNSSRSRNSSDNGASGNDTGDGSTSGSEADD